MRGIVFFMLIGRWFQDKSYDSFAFDRDYTSFFPLGVTVLQDGNEINKPLAELYDKGEILVADIETDPTYGLETFCVDNKYKSCYLLSLTDLDGRIIGVMGIYYINKKHKIVKDEWIFIRQKIGAIGNIMSNYLHSKK
jgi:hypothetical protein